MEFHHVQDSSFHRRRRSDDGSLANAQFLLGSNDNDHKQVTNLWAGQTEGNARHAAQMPTGTFGAPSGAFLLFSNENDHKAVGNTYGPQRSAARIPQDGVSMSTATAGRVSPGFLLGQTANGHKRVINQYSGNT